MATESSSLGALLVQAIESTRRYVAGVRQDQWTSSTPCTEWNVRQLVNHVIGENLWAAELFAGKTVADVGDRLDGDLTGDDPIAAYERSIPGAKRAVEAPGAMEVTCHLSFGDYPGAEYAKQLFMDQLVHGWDVAKATGQDTRLDPALAAACYPVAQELRAQFGEHGVFGEDLNTDPSADVQKKLLALLGRQA